MFKTEGFISDICVRTSDDISFFQNTDRIYNQEELGRGQLGNLKQDNFEYGAWSPVGALKLEDIVNVQNVPTIRDSRAINVATAQEKIEFLGDLVERGISARKSDDEEISKIEYFPLEEDTSKAGSSNRVEAVRNARDCKAK